MEKFQLPKISEVIASRHEALGMVKCDCGSWFEPSYGEFKRCDSCLSNQHSAAEFASCEGDGCNGNCCARTADP